MAIHLNWGVIATGSIAKKFAQGVAHSKTGKIIAVGSRSQEKADAFAKEFGIHRAYSSYDQVFADPEVEAVYIATPHPQHAHWAIRAAQAGKHILCEKPVGLNAAEAMAIIEAAEVHDVFLMEAYMYRCHPQTAKLVELIRQKAIGELKMIQAAFGFRAGPDEDSRIMNNAMGGGGILDVGGYPVSMARLLAGAAEGKPFADPTEVKGVGHLESTGVDGYAAAVLKFAGGIIAEVSTGVRLTQENVVRIYGTDGWILVPSPWVVAREGGKSEIILHRAGRDKPETITIETDQWLYGIEADTVAAHIEDRQAPQMSWADTMGNNKTQDAWRASLNFAYDAEKEGNIPTLSGRVIKAHPEQMKYGTIKGLDKKLSRLVMGCDNQPNLPWAAVMFDDWFERGGNVFDTAHIYGGGMMEKLLGQWIKTRGVRDNVAVIVKGVHTPYCFPDVLTVQLKQSLERLHIDQADIYIMHRDNPDVPVGEFVDVLNEHVKAGRIKVFGGSNWSLARMQQANEYAAKKGLQSFGVLSNNFSLARMVDPVWDGCVSASDPESRRWLAEKQMPLLAWSSQARGFFLEGRAAPDNLEDKELARCWYSDDNFRRLERARELARKKKVRPINIALAYVLHQPFPTYALIGPRQLSETRSSVDTLKVELTPEEVKWLNLES
jgi:predicted dehydrogenase/aryl-alcohol dehydrogenase-like predicted oxidoreductase